MLTETRRFDIEQSIHAGTATKDDLLELLETLSEFESRARYAEDQVWQAEVYAESMASERDEAREVFAELVKAVEGANKALKQGVTSAEAVEGARYILEEALPAAGGGA